VKNSGHRKRIGSATIRSLVRVLAGIAVIGFSLLFYQVLKSNRSLPTPAVERAEGRLVEVVPTRIESVPRTFRGHGTTAAERSSMVASELTARVAERPRGIRVGQWVNAGDTLLQLETTVFAERVRSFTANFEGLRADLETLDVELESTQERFRLSEISIALIDRELEDLESAVERGGAMRIEVDRLRRQKTILEIELENLQQTLAGIPSRRASLESRISAQRAELALAEIDLDRTVVRAPISGHIANVYADEGDTLSQGQSVARLVDLRRIEIPLRIPSAAARTVRRGDRAIIRDANGLNAFEGTVKRITPEIDPDSRTIAVFVEVEQEIVNDPDLDHSELLLPGQFVSGEIESSSTMQAILLPRSAIRADRVMILDPETSTAQPRSVEVAFFTEIDATDGRRTQWAVLSPSPAQQQEWLPPYLRSGESVIVSNLDGLTGGTPVRIANEGTQSP